MSYSNELMREVVIDHIKNPRHREKKEQLAKATVKNPACGDIMTLYLAKEDEKIIDLSYEVTGCSLSIASASMMSELLQNKTIDEAKNIAHHFYQMLMAKDYDSSILGDASALASVSKTPPRIKCVTLPYKAFFAILGEDNEKF